MGFACKAFFIFCLHINYESKISLATYATNTQRDLLIATIVLEAGGEGYHGMVAVANVIDNRAKKSHTSHYKVVRKPMQFSALNGRTNHEVICLAKGHKLWNVAADIVDQMLAGELTDITSGADHYHAIRITPKWSYKMTQTCTIKHHKFYRSNT